MGRRSPGKAVVAAAVAVIAVSARSHGQGPTPFEGVGLLPTNEKVGARYLGGATCAACHPSQASEYEKAAMAHASEPASACAVLASRPALTFETGRYRYRIQRRGTESIYEVTDGASTFSNPISWCFGHGQAGQTYVFERGGVFYESRVSYYSRIDGLAFTMGAPPGPPASLTEAIGRRMTRDDIRGCFGGSAASPVTIRTRPAAPTRARTTRRAWPVMARARPRATNP